MGSNNVRKVREAKMLSKTELARHAGISPLTLDGIEKGMPPGSFPSLRLSRYHPL